MNAAQQEQQLDALSNLEDRITRAVELVAALRAEKADLEDRLASALSDANAYRQELNDLRSERKQVRTRIEKLLGQMELLSAT